MFHVIKELFVLVGIGAATLLLIVLAMGSPTLFITLYPVTAIILLSFWACFVVSLFIKQICE